MLSRGLLLAPVITLAFAGPAAAALDRELVLDLDQSGPNAVDMYGDGTADEQIASPLQADGFLRKPQLTWACGLDTRTRTVLPRTERTLADTIRVRGASGAPLLVVFGSSGATGRVQHTWAHRLVATPEPGGCPRLKTLFRFPHRTTKTPKGPHRTAPGSFSAEAREVGGRIWFRTIEGLYRRTDGGCCPSYSRTIDWKPRGESYVRARARAQAASALVS